MTIFDAGLRSVGDKLVNPPMANNDQCWIGLDPGNSSGGIAAIYVEPTEGFAPRHVNAYLKLSKSTPMQVWAFLLEHGKYCRGAFLEKVHASPSRKDKETGERRTMGAQSSFKFGVSFGELRAFLIASCMPWLVVTPQAWQTALDCRTGGDKNVSKARAIDLYPKVDTNKPKGIPHWKADAMLLAHCARFHSHIGKAS
jgi:hypothetical protein